MLMLRHDAVRIELDDSEGATGALDRAREHAVPDVDRGHRVEIVECGHASSVSHAVEIRAAARLCHPRA
jgi:hypothetical protein